MPPPPLTVPVDTKYESPPFNEALVPETPTTTVYELPAVTAYPFL
jgi:hypothetical protein